MPAEQTQDAEPLVSVSAPWLGGPVTTKAPGGRPSKGDRDTIVSRPPLPLGELVRARAEAAGLTINDYVMAVLAQPGELPEQAPTTRPNTGRSGKDGRDMIMMRPPRQFGELVRARAEQAGMTLSDYVTSELARVHGLPRYAPAATADDTTHGQEADAQSAGDPQQEAPTQQSA